MSTYVAVLLEKFKSKGLLIDSNLLLLYLVGKYDIGLVGAGKWKRLSAFYEEDYQILWRLKSQFKKAVTTHHVLTEVSNLANDLPEYTKSECLSEFCATFDGIEELNVSSFEAARRTEFHFLGLTDCVLAQLATQFLIVTADLRLVSKLQQSGLEALNFNHLREHLFS